MNSPKLNNFAEAFSTAMGNHPQVAPYDYQTRLACGQTANLTLGTSCQSQLIEIPTGLGKTAGLKKWLGCGKKFRPCQNFQTLFTSMKPQPSRVSLIVKPPKSRKTENCFYF